MKYGKASGREDDFLHKQVQAQIDNRRAGNKSCPFIRFGDGEKQCYWVLKYANGMFRYVCSFTQMGEASGDFIYTGYIFEDGMCTKSDIYYNTQYGASNLYSDFGQAVAAFFSGYGIQMDSNAANDGFDYDIYGAFQSILSQGNDKTLFFELTNTMTALSSDGLNNVAQYSATLRNGNGIPDQRE